MRAVRCAVEGSAYNGQKLKNMDLVGRIRARRTATEGKLNLIGRAGKLKSHLGEERSSRGSDPRS